MSFPTVLHLFFWDRLSHWAWNSHIQLHWLASESLASTVSASPAATLESFIAMFGLVKDGLQGLWTQVLMLLWWVLCQLSHLLSPPYCFTVAQLKEIPINILVLLLSLTKQTSDTIKKKNLILTQGVRGLSPCPLSPTHWARTLQQWEHIMKNLIHRHRLQKVERWRQERTRYPQKVCPDDLLPPAGPPPPKVSRSFPVLSSKELTFNICTGGRETCFILNYNILLQLILVSSRLT